MADIEAGRVSDYMADKKQAALELVGPIKVGDRVKITGRATNLSFPLATLLGTNNAAIEDSPKNRRVTIAVPGPCQEGDWVYVVT